MNFAIETICETISSYDAKQMWAAYLRRFAACSSLWWYVTGICIYLYSNLQENHVAGPHISGAGKLSRLRLYCYNLYPMFSGFVLTNKVDICFGFAYSENFLYIDL